MADTCKRGHERTVENTYVHSESGQLTCRPCNREAHKRYRLANPVSVREQHRRYRKLNLEKVRATERRNHRHRLYGLSQADYDTLLASQGGVCAICASPDRLEVDHDHSHCEGKRACGVCVRGILCHQCNTGLGKYNDDPSRARTGRFADPTLAAKAIAYVQSFRLTLAGIA